MGSFRRKSSSLLYELVLQRLLRDMSNHQRPLTRWASATGCRKKMTDLPPAHSHALTRRYALSYAAALRE
jgi:hypothetical protein